MKDQILRTGTKVKVGKHPDVFTGKVDGVLHWTNPFSPFNKKGFDYIVSSDADKKQHRVPSTLVEKI